MDVVLELLRRRIHVQMCNSYASIEVYIRKTPSPAIEAAAYVLAFMWNVLLTLPISSRNVTCQVRTNGRSERPAGCVFS